MRLEFQRVDLKITIGRDRLLISSGDLTDHYPPITTPSELATPLAQSAAVAHWRALPIPPADGPILDRIALDIRDPKLAAESWELAFSAVKRTPFLVSPAIVRVSPVRPRCANFPFTVPLRLLEVNPPSNPPVLIGLNYVFHGNPLMNYASAVRFEQASWLDWSTAGKPSDWPNVDVCHCDALPPFPADMLSADAKVPGTLGWFVEQAVSWQVRLIVLRAAGPSVLADARRFAAAIVGRGGPAILVDAFVNNSESDDFYKFFYEHLIHDAPLDSIFETCLQYIHANPLDATLFVGAGREEQLRPSTIAFHIAKFAPEAKTSARRREVIKIFGPQMPRKHQHRLNWSLERAADELSAAEPAYEFHTHERGGMLPMADVLSTLRVNMTGPVSASEFLSAMVPPSRKASEKPAPRFVNASFWSESTHGELAPIDQKTGSFTGDGIYHLGIQIGPKNVKVITVNETALFEEIFKWTPEMEGVWIEIGITALDFDVLGDPVQRVWLPRTGPSEMVYFAVSPRKDGACRLRFSIFYEQNVIQSFLLAAIAGTASSDRAAALAKALNIPKRLSLDAAYLPLLEFSLMTSVDQLVTRSAPPEHALCIVANDSNGDSTITVKGRSSFSVHVSQDLGGYVDGVRTLLHELSGTKSQYPFMPANTGTQQRLEDALRQLADAGRGVYNELFDADDWANLQSRLAEPDRSIQVAQILREKVIPWSFVYGRMIKPLPGHRDAQGKLANMPVCLAPLPDADGVLSVKQCGRHPQCLVNGYPQSKCVDAQGRAITPENVICPLEFWGFKHIIEIPPQQVAAKEGKKSQAAGAKTEITIAGKARMVAGVNSRFPSEQAHFTALQSIKSKIPLDVSSKQYTVAGLITDLAKSPVHVAYFFCHADSGAMTRKTRLILQAPGANTQPESILAQEFVDQLNAQKWNPPALVFLNGCNTVNYSPEALSPFLRAFIDQLGASGLIGTEITVWDTFAAEIANRFFENFLNGDSAGEALLKARRALLNKCNPLGLVYTLYASGSLRAL